MTKRAICFVIACLTACSGVDPTGRILEKIDNGGPLWKSIEKLKLLLQSDKNMSLYMKTK